MTEQEQSKKIDELERQVTKLESVVEKLNLDLKPSGRVSNAFDVIKDHLNEHDWQLNRLQYSLNQVNGKLDAILDRITELSVSFWKVRI